MNTEINQTAEDFASDMSTPAKVTPTDLQTLMGEYGTKSALIRHLNGQGWKRARIAKFMNIKYQFVRNVLTQPEGKKKGETL